MRFFRSIFNFIEVIFVRNSLIRLGFHSRARGGLSAGQSVAEYAMLLIAVFVAVAVTAHSVGSQAHTVFAEVARHLH